MICLERLDDPQFGPARPSTARTASTGRAWRSCERGVQQRAQCRARLPDSAEKMFDDGLTMFLPIQRRVELSDGLWGPLSRRRQRQ